MTTDAQNADAKLWIISRGKKKARPVEDELVVGHKDSCDLQIKDRKLLAEHFKIVRQDDGFHLCVFQNAKVKLNGEAATYAELNSGDTLKVGPYRFEFEVAVAGAGSSSAASKTPILVAAAAGFVLLAGLGAFFLLNSGPDKKENQDQKDSKVAKISDEKASDSHDEVGKTKPVDDPDDVTPDEDPLDAEPKPDEEPPKDEEKGDEKSDPVKDEPEAKEDAGNGEKTEPKAAPMDPEGEPEVLPEAGIDLAALQLKYNALMQVQKYDEAKTLVEGALAKANETQKTTLQSWLKAIDNAQWALKKPQIAKHWNARDRWLDSVSEVRELVKYLEHKQWSFRAIGATGIVSKNDPRAYAEVIPLLKDKSTLVRSFVLKALAKVPDGKLKTAKDGYQIVEAVIREMMKNKKITYYSKAFLKGLSGENHKTKSKWSRWLKDHKDDFKPDISEPFDISQFSKDDLSRYQREVMAAQRAKAGGTVLRADQFKSHMDELRKNGLEIAICLDVTGSMGGVLKESKEKIESLSMILGTLVGNVRIGLVTYRDAVATVLPLTKNWSAFKRALDSQQASGGGDGPEGVEKGVEVCLFKMGWKKKSNKSIVIIADAPPHKADLPRFEELAKGSKKVNVVIHGLYTRAVVPDIATYVKISGGKNSTLASDAEFLKNFLLLIFGEGLEPYIKSFLEIYQEIQEDLKPKPKKK
ncbi:MAG: VWA domain-containing protein [Planctomycetota bacterium]|nr:VWA domain-containing protein [Planctomycetota bacterium]